jgi:bifunctional DNase/RNase
MKRVLVEVTGITGCAPYQGYVVILREHEGNRWLPIFIGALEAQNISLLLQGLKYARPLTYDLFYNLLEAASTKVENITVTELRDNTFYAEVSLRVGTRSPLGVDARPSDAIALAIKCKCPIFVSSKVMEEAGLVGEMSPAQPDHTEKLKELNKRLQKAVEQEAYEEAARIRDQIRALEAQENTN